MKNEDMDRLAVMAEELAEEIPSLLLDGDGNFRHLEVPEHVFPAHDLLRSLESARKKAHEISEMMALYPRRKQPSK